LSDYCDEYKETLIGSKQKKKKGDDEEIAEDNLSGVRALLCPPAGSSTNLSSKK
jgi:hypothetical protein